jgi:hypothetical protein
MSRYNLIILATLPIVAGCGSSFSASEVEAGTRLSDALADRFQRDLQDRLQAALAEGGPVRAIEVCAVEAPGIAARLSAESGATVRRTALRNRNPGATSDAFEAAVMQGWADDPLEAPGRPRTLAKVEGGELRYMRAIPTQGQCLACHGRPEQIAPEVRSALAARYPADRATGFAEGQMRGAFSIRWTVPALRAALTQQPPG